MNLLLGEARNSYYGSTERKKEEITRSQCSTADLLPSHPSSLPKESHLSVSGPRYYLDFFSLQLSWPFLLPDPACPIMCWNGRSVSFHLRPWPAPGCIVCRIRVTVREGAASTASDILRHSTSEPINFVYSFLLMNSMFLQFVMESPTFDFADWRALPALRSSLKKHPAKKKYNEPHSSCWEPKIQGFHPASFAPNQL